MMPYEGSALTTGTLGLRIDAWRGGERLARDLPVVSWAFSDKWPSVPSAKLTAAFPMALYPANALDPLRPMGQILRAELTFEGRTRALPPFRITRAAPNGAEVSVEADSLDLGIQEDEWAYPSSPATGSTFLQEARRLAEPVPVRLGGGMSDVTLPTGIAWSGKRDQALLELVAGRAARWSFEADGALWAYPLGSPTEPDHTVTGWEVTDAPRELRRDRANKGSAVVKGEGSDAAPAQVIVRRLIEAMYDPEDYGTIGRVVTLDSGTSQEDAEAAATALLAEAGAERKFTITPLPELRSGQVLRVELEHPEGPEVVTGRVISQTLSGDGKHDVTMREAR